MPAKCSSGILANLRLGRSRGLSSLLASRLVPISPRVQIPAFRKYSSSAEIVNGIETVPLAFEMHEPAKPVTDRCTKPILFLHGFLGSKKNNRTMSRVLARDLGRYIYNLDLRNHGDSPHTERHDYLAMAADVTAFIQAHNLKETTVIGHSMGAKTAMTIALQSPDLLADVVPVDNAPVDAALSSDFGKYIRGMLEIDAAHVTRQADADKILEKYESNLVIRQFLLGNLHRDKAPHHKDAHSSVLKFRLPVKTLGKALANMADFPFKDPQERRFKKPALVVRGTESPYVPDEVLPLIGEFFPLFELADIKAGHWVISEKPEDFRKAVVAFLSPKE